MEINTWNEKVEHPLQAYEWGEFRKATGVGVVREDGIQVTIHKIPYTPWNVGYAPKIIAPFNQSTIKTLKKIAKDSKCIFIKCEPKVEMQDERSKERQLSEMGFVEGRPLFTKYNFVLDVTPSEEELLASFKQKTRYNIKVAQKRGVTVELDDSPDAFERYLQLTAETTKRQGFYAHSSQYHRKMWEILGNSQISNSLPSQAGQILKLSAHLLVAKYPPSSLASEGHGQGEIITTWVLFKFKDTLYYPYGASTREHREVMANNLVMWEAIKLAKQWGCKYLDMWGALGTEPSPEDPWIGFHNFKSGYGARHVEYIGTWDYVAMPMLYKIYRLVESLRWKILKLLK